MLQVINQLNEHMHNVCLELATVGDLKLCERPQTYQLAPHQQIHIRANIKVSSTETGIVYGNIVYDTGESRFFCCLLFFCCLPYMVV